MGVEQPLAFMPPAGLSSLICVNVPNCQISTLAIHVSAVAALASNVACTFCKLQSGIFDYKAESRVHETLNVSASLSSSGPRLETISDTTVTLIKNLLLLSFELSVFPRLKYSETWHHVDLICVASTVSLVACITAIISARNLL